MASVNTNAAAITALRTLQSTNNQLDATQNRISTGLKIGEAKDNAAYWAISTTLKSDNKSLSTVKDALGLGAATVDVAYQGLNKAKDVLDTIKSKLTAATQPGVDRNVIQAEIKELQKQLESIAGSSVFSGENWLSVDSSATDYDATKKIVASFSRDSNNSVAIGTVDVAIGGVALFDKSTVADKNGILDGMQNLKDKDGKDLKIGGTASTSGNSLDAGLTVAGTTGKADGALTAPGVANGGASAINGGAATPTAVAEGAADSGTAGTQAAAGNYTGPGTGYGSYDASDLIKFDVTIDGEEKNFQIVVGSTLNDIKNLINGASGFNRTVATGTSVLSLTSTTTGTDSDVLLDNVRVTSADGLTTRTGTTLANLAVAADSGAATGGGALGAAYTTGDFESSGLASGDKVSVSFYLNGNTAANLHTVEVDLTTPDVASDDAVAAAIQAAIAAEGITDLTVVVNAGNNKALDFSSTTTGATKSFQLLDITVKNAGGVFKNTDILGGFTESKAASVTTNNITFGTPGVGSTDKVKLGLTVNGVKLDAVAVTAGADIDDLVANINASGLNTKVVASKSGTALVLTSLASGGTSAVAIDTVSFTDEDDVSVNRSGTGFQNVATMGTATTGNFPASGITLDANDNLYFNIAVDGGASKLVTIDQALVNKTLSTDAVPVTDGTIANADDFKAVMDKALQAAGITGLETSVIGTTNKQLVFTSDKLGAGSSVAVTNTQASQGANQISVSTLDISDAGLDKLNVASGDDITKVLSAYISVVNNAINQVTTAASNLGAVASRIDMQKDFVNTLMDTIDKGVGNLIDADMSEESTKLQALQVKQQLGVQALSIANQSSQNILRLFQ